MFCTWMGQLELQWNLRTKDTLGLIVLSLVERLSLSRRLNNTLKYEHGAATSVLCREVVPISEGSLSEVPLS